MFAYTVHRAGHIYNHKTRWQTSWTQTLESVHEAAYHCVCDCSCVQYATLVGQSSKLHILLHDKHGLYSIYCLQVKVKLNLHGVVGVESVQQVDEEEYEEKVKRPVVKVLCAYYTVIAQWCRFCAGG